ncbi:MAG: glycosyltransferase [Actinomycetota bacterium]|jgi:GT2 family glycosyltransferase
MTDSGSPELSLLVVSWRTRDLLAECLDTIAAELDGLSYEVVVVDNDSGDGTANLVAERAAADDRIRPILSDTNTGFAGGNNLAYRASRGEFVGVVNPDLLVNRDAVYTMVERLRADPSIGVLSCDLVGMDGRQQTLHRRLPTLTNLLFTRTRWGGRFDRIVLRRWFDRRLRLADVPRHGLRDIGQAAGAFLFLRRATIEGPLGGELFDEKLEILVNDVDLSRRVHDAGLRVAVDYDRRVMHHGGGSLRQLDRTTQERHLFEGFAHYFAKHEPPWKLRLFRLLCGGKV